jgi:hypothetical protein
MRTHLLLPILLLVACGDASLDGGPRTGPEREAECNGDAARVVVLVTEADGAPVEGAEVIARHLGTNLTVTGTTDARGVTTAVTSDLGQGSVVVQAVRGTEESSTGAVLFSCTPCSCAAEPGDLTLTFGG